MKYLLLLLTTLSVSATIAQGHYWQQEVDYKMSIDFDVSTHRYTGTQRLVYANHSPDTLYHVYYHLYFNAFQPNSMMDVRSRTIEDPDRRVRDRIFHLSEDEIGFIRVSTLRQDGQTVCHRTEGTILEVDLEKPIPPGSRATFDMEFEAQVPIQVRRSGRDNAEGISYSMSQWYPKMAEYDKWGWHAHPYVAREFYAPWGNYEVNITIDKSFVLGGTGILTNGDEVGYGYQTDPTIEPRRKGKNLTWKFKAEQVHDFVWAADPDYKHVTAQVPNGPLLHFLYQEDSTTLHWAHLPEYTIRAFEYCNETFGQYPYPQFSVIQGGDGGMEYPMATLITGKRSLKSLVGVTVHEAIHSWFQGVVATNESYFAWMDEGFTSFATSVTMTRLFDDMSGRPGSGSYRGYFALASSGIEEPSSTHSDHFETNFAYGRAAYSKGAVGLIQLGYIIGDEIRDRGLKRYYEEWKFKHPDMIDFIRVMEKTSDIELDWYYDYWINSTKTIDYAIDSVHATEENQTRIILRRVQYMPMPIDLTVTRKDGSKVMYYIPLGIMRGTKPNESSIERVVMQDWYWTHPQYELTIDLPIGDISRIEIDESHRMADIDTNNNVWTQ